MNKYTINLVLFFIIIFSLFTNCSSRYDRADSPPSQRALASPGKIKFKPKEINKNERDFVRFDTLGIKFPPKLNLDFQVPEMHVSQEWKAYKDRKYFRVWFKIFNNTVKSWKLGKQCSLREPPTSQLRNCFRYSSVDVPFYYLGIVGYYPQNETEAEELTSWANTYLTFTGDKTGNPLSMSQEYPEGIIQFKDNR